MLVLIFIYSLEAKVKRLGKTAAVSWCCTDPDYLQSLKTAKEKTRLQVLENLHQTSAERLFLLDLMKKYASKFYVQGFFSVDFIADIGFSMAKHILFPQLEKKNSQLNQYKHF
jgi:hypothetical protein